MAKPRCLPVELWYVHCAVCSVGFSLNSLLLWLILRRTNKELKRFARILLCTNVMDLFYVLWAFFVDWVSRLRGVSLTFALLRFQRSHFRDGIYFAVINGYLSRVSDVPLALKFTILAFNGYWLHTMLTFVAVPFAYRYLVFCRYAANSLLVVFKRFSVEYKGNFPKRRGTPGPIFRAMKGTSVHS